MVNLNQKSFLNKWQRKATLNLKSDKKEGEQKMEKEPKVDFNIFNADNSDITESKEIDSSSEDS